MYDKYQWARHGLREVIYEKIFKMQQLVNLKTSGYRDIFQNNFGIWDFLRVFTTSCSIIVLSNWFLPI